MSGGRFVVTLSTGALESPRDAALLDAVGREARRLGMVLSRGTSDETEWHMQTEARAEQLRTYARGLKLPKWWRLT